MEVPNIPPPSKVIEDDDDDCNIADINEVPTTTISPLSPRKNVVDQPVQHGPIEQDDLDNILQIPEVIVPQPSGGNVESHPDGINQRRSHRKCQPPDRLSLKWYNSQSYA